MSNDNRKKDTGKNNGEEFDRHTVHNLIILDESGSMDVIKNATIQGFNEVVQTIKGIQREYPEQKHYVSFVTFNGLGISEKLFCRKVDRLDEIDDGSYRPDANTPLYDAIGFSVNKLLGEVGKGADRDVLVTILTDGMENASKEYSGRAIAGLIESLKGQGWTFTYIGANHDVERAASDLSIVNHLKFEPNEDDVRRAFSHDTSSRRIYSKKIRRKEERWDDYFEDGK